MPNRYDPVPTYEHSGAVNEAYARGRADGLRAANALAEAIERAFAQEEWGDDFEAAVKEALDRFRQATPASTGKESNGT